MGIGRPPDPYGMTTPPAWPEVDEDILRNCADAFDTVLKTVSNQLEAAQRERTQMFDGVGIWSGGGANAARNALDKRIADLESVKEKLDASVKLFNDSVSAVVNAKNQIINNVDAANKAIDNIRNNVDAQEGTKEAAIQAIVNATRGENIEVVTTAGSRISGKPSNLVSSWKPPGNGLSLFGPGGPQNAPVIPASNLANPAPQVEGQNSPGPAPPASA